MKFILILFFMLAQSRLSSKLEKLLMLLENELELSDSLDFEDFEEDTALPLASLPAPLAGAEEDMVGVPANPNWSGTAGGVPIYLRYSTCWGGAGGVQAAPPCTASIYKSMAITIGGGAVGFTIAGSVYAAYCPGPKLSISGAISVTANINFAGVGGPYVYKTLAQKNVYYGVGYSETLIYSQPIAGVAVVSLLGQLNGRCFYVYGHAVAGCVTAWTGWKLIFCV